MTEERPVEPRHRTRLRVGVIGCGLIAQVMHLPYLRELHEEFEVVALCDVSPDALRFAGDRFFPNARRHADWADAVADDLDAVLVLTAGSHAPIAAAAAAAGRHALVEKPVALGVAEGLEAVAAAEAAGVCHMAAYMKRYDAAYEAFVPEVAALEDLRLVRVTTLEAPMDPYVGVYPRQAATGVDPARLAALLEEDDRRVRAAIGAHADDPTLRRGYREILLDCLVHEFNALRGLLGEPDELAFAAVADGARGITAVLRFGATECVLMWAELPELGRYQQELAFVSPAARATLDFPSPFLRNAATRIVTERGEPGSADAYRAERIVSFDEAFRRELLEFHAAATMGRPPRTPLVDGVHDLALARSVIEAAATGRPVPAPSALPAAAQAGGAA